MPIVNKYSSTAVTVTDTTVVNNGGKRMMQLNGSSSKVDCGSYDPLTGDKTFICWAKAWSAGGGNVGRIFDNGKLMIYTDGTKISVTSDGSTTVSSAASSIKLGSMYMIVVTRTSTGIVNIYINSVLSGTANQASGTPVAGTTNIILGNNNAGSATWFGLLDCPRIFSGILSVFEIAQMFSSERKLYSV